MAAPANPLAMSLNLGSSNFVSCDRACSLPASGESSIDGRREFARAGPGVNRQSLESLAWRQQRNEDIGDTETINSLGSRAVARLTRDHGTTGNCPIRRRLDIQTRAAQTVNHE